jgi:non-ribosomal peptide synthetase component F
LPIQYKDYAAWLNRLLEGPEGERMKNYWLEKLSGRLAALDLPGDVPADTANTPRWTLHPLRLDPARTAALTSLGERQGATLFMTLLTAIKALFYRYTGQEDIIVGTPVAGRALPDFESGVGPYMNVVALRDTVSGVDRYDALLARVRDTSLEAFANALYPLDWLLDALHVRRAKGRNPVFDIGFTLQNQRSENDGRDAGPVRIRELPELTRRALTAEAQTYFWFLASPRADGMDIDIVHDAARFSEAFVSRLANEFVALLDETIADPGIRLCRLTLGHAPPRAPGTPTLELAAF